MVVLFLWSGGKIYFSCFRFNNYYRFKDWGQGLKQVAEEVRKVGEDKEIVMANVQGEPYIQMLYYLKYDPARYQRENFEVSKADYYKSLERNKVKKIGNLTIRPLVWREDVYEEQYLIFDDLGLSEDNFAEHCFQPWFKVVGEDGKLLYWGVRTDPERKIREGKCGV